MHVGSQSVKRNDRLAIWPTTQQCVWLDLVETLYLALIRSTADLQYLG